MTGSCSASAIITEHQCVVRMRTATGSCLRGDRGQWRSSCLPGTQHKQLPHHPKTAHELRAAPCTTRVSQLLVCHLHSRIASGSRTACYKTGVHTSASDVGRWAASSHSEAKQALRALMLVLQLTTSWRSACRVVGALVLLVAARVAGTAAPAQDRGQTLFRYTINCHAWPWHGAADERSHQNHYAGRRVTPSGFPGRALGAGFLPACCHGNTSLRVRRRPARGRSRPRGGRRPACRLRRRWRAAEPRVHACRAGVRRIHLSLANATPARPVRLLFFALPTTQRCAKLGCALQEAGRTLACRMLAHVLQLGPAFHASRSVGSLARIVDRGDYSIERTGSSAWLVGDVSRYACGARLRAPRCA